MKVQTKQVVRLGWMIVAAATLAWIALRSSTGNQTIENGWTWLLLAGIGVAVWYWRKKRHVRKTLDHDTWMKCLDRVSLAPGRSLHLIELDGSRLLIACGEGGIRLLLKTDARTAESVSAADTQDNAP